MKVFANCILTAILSGILALSHCPTVIARALPNNSTPMDSVNANDTKQNATTVGRTQEVTGRSNDTAVTALPAQTKSLETLQPTGGAAIARIKRKKRETEVTLPFDFHTVHLPCDMDQPGRMDLVEGFPNQCIWAWNNKYVHEGFFRVYKTYQLEAFFFGQYYERLKRFELDPLVFDY